jgi:BirA family biotin operon repressor/biotin-[acetyl-CoA-carboxylase] ligase
MKIKLDELEKKYEPLSGKLESNYFNEYVIEWFDNVPSTMDVVEENIKKNIFNKIIVANYQDKGQGRFGRQWESPIGKNLLLSLPLELDSKNLNRIPVISTVSVLNVIRFFLKDSQEISIKWPNDILVNEKKISGIIIKTFSNQKNSIVNLGIGININTKLSDYEDVDFQATSLRIENELVFDIYHVFYKLIKSLSDSLESDYFDIFNYWKEKILIPKKNINIRISEYSDNIACKPIGVNNQGLLVVETAIGDRLELTSEEVTFHY